MKKLLESLGLADPEPSVLLVEPVDIDHFADVDMEAFTKWCKEMNVSTMARSSEFCIIVGNHIKYVDRF